jgi:hypothetical protein
VVDRNGIVRAGNGTLEAARRLGWDTVAVVETELNGVEATAYAIADNRTAELAEWDDDVLAATLNSLAIEDGLLDAAGFDEDELEKLLDAMGGNESQEPSASSSEEVDVDSFELDTKCPRCGFEFNDKKA